MVYLLVFNLFDFSIIMIKKIVYTAAFAALGLMSSCDKYLDVQPVGTVIPTSEADFRALLTSGYLTFPTHKSLLNLRTDELLLDEFSTDMTALKDIYTWKDQNPDRTTLVYPWLVFYKTMFYCNHLLNDIDSKLSETPEVKQLKAEALALRAYARFEMINCYAEQYSTSTKASKAIPMSNVIDLEQKFPVATLEEVYQAIFEDLSAAAALMQLDDQESATRYRFSKRSLSAFEARLHLYRQEWPEAIAAANAALAINADLVDLNQSGALLPNDFESVESILALENPAIPTVHSSTSVATGIIDLYGADDQRLPLFFQRSGSKFMSLKGGNDRYKVSFRNAEMYLIIAESAVNLGDKVRALNALNTLAKNRLTTDAFAAQATELAAMDLDDLQQFVRSERERELALEGLRWYDLKRWGRPRITHELLGNTHVLEANDPRYVIRYPQEAINKNPELLR